jgi:hypothetical protein
MFSELVVALSVDPITGQRRVTRQGQVFFDYLLRITPDLYVRSVAFIRLITGTTAFSGVVVIVISAPHPVLVVLPLSHGDCISISIKNFPPRTDVAFAKPIGQLPKIGRVA